MHDAQIDQITQKKRKQGNNNQHPLHLTKGMLPLREREREREMYTDRVSFPSNCKRADEPNTTYTLLLGHQIEHSSSLANIPCQV